ncbi:hypothetical protein HB852_01610 [Listeria grandensis]|uniref:immunoglobulin-like domain-containing protein n=1 Tax=Listeria grandensis TaxID=1494963 RepID=UPI001627E3A4|nr:immunoglobulin-like domain-containing protein [Listeria grandensis]MBC1473315.1 hypothetical protein [Listeria grandensis]
MRIYKGIVFFIVLFSMLVGGITYHAHADEVKTKEMYVLENPTWLFNAGMSKGVTQDKQDLGIVLPANTKLEIRQTNPNFKGDLVLELLNTDAKKESEASFNSEWKSVSSEYTAVPFVRTTFTSEAPVIEYKVTDTMTELPTYSKDTNEDTYFQKWDASDAAFGLITTDYVQILIPKEDKAYLKKMDKFSSIDGLVKYYDSVFEKYNELAGLSFHPARATDKNIPNKYFMKADAASTPTAYYGPYYSGAKGSSAKTYMDADFIALHEIAHGYEGNFKEASLNVNEAWNELYCIGFLKNTVGNGLESDGWLLSFGGKELIERNVENNWHVNPQPINSWLIYYKTIFLATVQEKTGDQAFIHFNQEYRKMVYDGLEMKDKQKLLDLISKYYGETSKFDITPAIKSVQGSISDKQAEDNRYHNYTPVASLNEVVPSKDVAGLQKQLGLVFPFSLVDTDQLATVSSLSGEARLKLDINDFSQIEGEDITIMNGSKVVRKVKVTSPDMVIDNLPNGIYTMYLPLGKSMKYAVSEHYLRIKESVNNVTIKYTEKQASPLANQDIHFLGLGDNNYALASVDISRNEIEISTSAKDPHSYFGSDIYSKIEVLDENGNVTYTKIMTGANTSLGSVTTHIEPGYKLRIYHIEPNRLLVDGVSMKQTTSIFNVTKTGLVNEDGTTKDTLISKIEKAALEIQSNPLMMAQSNVERKNDLGLAILALAEPERSTLLSKYADIANASLPEKMVTDITTLNTVTQKTGKIAVNILPKEASQKVTFVSSDPSVLKINSAGEWETVGAGNANIIITSNMDETLQTIIPVVVEVSNDALTVKPYRVGESDITGTFGSNIWKVRLWINDKVVAQATTNADGSYQFANASSFVKLATDKVEVVGVDKAYVEKNRIQVPVEKAADYDAHLTASTFNDTMTQLSGTYGKDIFKVRLWVNDKVVTQATTKADGTYEFPNASSFISKKTDKVEVVAVDSQYNEITRIEVTLDGNWDPKNKLTAEDYFIQGSYLSGTYESDIYKVRLWVNGAVVAQASTENGSYKFKNISSFIYDGDAVEVVAVDKQYKEINRIQVKVATDINRLIIGANYSLGNKALIGTYGSDIKAIKLFVNGKFVQDVTLDTAKLTYEVDKADTIILKKTDSVCVKGYDSSGQEITQFIHGVK